MSLPMSSYHDNFNAAYIPPNREVNLPYDQDLFKTISEGTEQELLELLSFGVSVNIRDNFNNTPLHAALIKGNIGMARALLKYGADVDALGFNGKSPLHLSVVSKNLVQLLLKHQPNFTLQDDEGNWILHYFLRLPNWWEDLDIRSAIKSVLSAVMNVNIPNKAGESPLHKIITEARPDSSGYMEIILDFLNCKPNVSTPMRNGQSLLGVFLENTNILLKDTSKWGAPEWVHAGFRCLEEFLILGANPNFTFRSQPLVHYCLKTGIFREGCSSESFLVRLLEEAYLDISGSDGNYPLHTALARNDHRWDGNPKFPICKVTSTFIDRQVDVNKPNRAGESPLELWLTGQGYRPPAVLKKVSILLIEAGASTTVTTTDGKSLFNFITSQTREPRIFLTRTLLEADIRAQPLEDDAVAGSEWGELWRSAWKQSHWSFVRKSLTELDDLNSRPKTKYFMECAFLIVAERLLERHRSRLRSFLEKELVRESVVKNYEEYCTILRDCRERKADIDVSFYTFLLDVSDLMSCNED
ncbi:ankyrin repeat-containing domain protein [Cadophora sp. MPI-SDFR-AT-0126]|nr:ankyrin repeat-containing domain protein [Leotiomycetes sp. MPI-SDFR-AT-0126]